jgi:plastocyanin
MLIALALAAAVFAGCGGDDEESSGSAATPTATATQEATETPAAEAGGGETLAFSAPEDGSLKFDQSDVKAKAGKVTITFSNPSSVPHAVAIEGNGVDEETETVTGSDAPPIDIDLAPGTYTFYCPVGGHEQAGMKGTLTVE